jgi:hypothetical protein
MHVVIRENDCLHCASPTEILPPVGQGSFDKEKGLKQD